MEWSWHRPLSLERFWLLRLFFKHQKFKFQGQNTREISWWRGMSIEFQASGNLAHSCKFARFVANSDKSCNLPVFCLATYTECSDFKRGGYTVWKNNAWIQACSKIYFFRYKLATCVNFPGFKAEKSLNYFKLEGCRMQGWGFRFQTNGKL